MGLSDQFCEDPMNSFEVKTFKPAVNHMAAVAGREHTDEKAELLYPTLVKGSHNE